MVAFDGSSDLAIPILETTLKREPNDPLIVVALMIRLLAVKDYDGASVQFKRLYQLAPQSATVKDILKRRRDP